MKKEELQACFSTAPLRLDEARAARIAPGLVREASGSDGDCDAYIAERAVRIATNILELV